MLKINTLKGSERIGKHPKTNNLELLIRGSLVQVQSEEPQWKRGHF